MKVYLVVPSFENFDALGNPKTRHVFTKKADAQKFYIKMFVKPWFDKYPNKKVKDYFKFDPYKPRLTSAEFTDIITTFNESGEIHHVSMN